MVLSRFLAVLAGLSAALTAQPIPINPGPARHDAVQAGLHEMHLHHNAAGPAPRLIQTQVFPAPGNAEGNMAYDRQSGRMWWISFGPPANPSGRSKVYELAADGSVIAEAPLALNGSFGSPAVSDGVLYVPVAYQSKICKIDVRSVATLGQDLGALPLPSMTDLPGIDRPSNGESLRFPWLDVVSLSVTSTGTLLAYAEDIGELIELDTATGRVLQRVKTVKGLGSAVSFSDGRGTELVLADYDAEDAAARAKARRFVTRSPEQIAAKKTRVTFFSRRPDDKTVTWVLLDRRSGWPLASVDIPHSTAYASTIALISAKPGESGYGRLKFLAAGTDGILTLEWSPAGNQ